MPRPTPAAPVTGAHRRVLVVEDDADVAALLVAHLTRLGWRADAVATGEDALLSAADDAPDVAVVDLGLPGMGGDEVVRELRRRRTTRCCRIVVTSVLDRDTQEALVPDAVLPKPFTRSDVGRVMLGLEGRPPRNGVTT